jgi:hypothetical protein
MEETLEQFKQKVARILAEPSGPIDRNKPYVFRYYRDPRVKDKPGLWVTLGGREIGRYFIVAHGREGRGWREDLYDYFWHLERDGDAGEARDMLTEAEARQLAQSIGLDIDVIKAMIVDGFTKANKYSPNIEVDDVEALLAYRKQWGGV